ncbi:MULTISPECIES: SdpI family protein [unclassified Nocardiopsis]|uniref:SdpI family protein n=1 Tax=unclassified Nocardiopsis TaxID=2649073 RepID=UPI001300E5F4|nr:SdpI family protein [Nocardiopsis sp. TSRI0078]
MEEAIGLVAAVLGLVVAAGAAHYVRSATRDGALERNAFLGLRTRATLSSDRAWREGHLAAGPWLVAAVRGGYLAAAAAAAAALAAMAADAFLLLAWAAVAVGYAVLLALLVIGTVRADAAAKASPREGAR